MEPFHKRFDRIIANAKKCGKGWIPEGSKCHKDGSGGEKEGGSKGWKPKGPGPEPAWKKGKKSGFGKKKTPGKNDLKAGVEAAKKFVPDKNPQYADMPDDMKRMLRENEKGSHSPAPKPAQPKPKPAGSGRFSDMPKDMLDELDINDLSDDNKADLTPGDLAKLQKKKKY